MANVQVIPISAAIPPLPWNLLEASDEATPEPDALAVATEDARVDTENDVERETETDATAEAEIEVDTGSEEIVLVVEVTGTDKVPLLNNPDTVGVGL
jgi:hypothetical protein